MSTMALDTVTFLAFSKSGREFLSKVHNSQEYVDEAAQRVHGKWMNAKSAERTDPLHPFQGCAPPGSGFETMRRVRVNQLTREEIGVLNAKFGIKVDYDPTDTRDVFHSLYKPQVQLAIESPRDAGKNRVPVYAVLQALSAHMGTEFSISELKGSIESVISGKSTPGAMLRRIILNAVHLGWQCGEATYGLTVDSNPDFLLFDDLEAKTQEYDVITMDVVLGWLLEKIEEVHLIK